LQQQRVRAYRDLQRAAVCRGEVALIFLPKLLEELNERCKVIGAFL
jgi:hypothetical protein